jgi:hypothetical protein
MRNKIEKVGLGLLSAKDFQDEKIVLSILEKINNSPFVPDIYGFCEPLKYKYDIEDISEPAKVWMHEEVNKKLARHNQAGGSLMMVAKNEERGFYHFDWNKLQDKTRFNFASFSVGIDFLKYDNNYDEFIKLCKEIVKIVEPVHGDISNWTLPNWSAPMDLKIRLPEIRWMNFYGKPYVEMFGKKKLLSTPCCKAEAITEDIIAIQATENLFEDIPDEVRTNIKMHLGEDAFVWGNKAVRGYKDGKVPNFDYSGVLFTKEK